MVTASIVVYRHSRDELIQAIESVVRSCVAALYIVDNSPCDQLREILIPLSDKICYIHGQGNVGYGKAHNMALDRAMEKGAEYHIIVNPDIYFEPEIIAKLVHYMENRPDVGSVMPKVVYPDGNLQYLCKLLPGPHDLFLRRFLPSSLAQEKREKFELRFSGYEKEMNVPFLSGCFMFLRIDALKKVGLFDRRFFMYGEDIDLSRRIHRQYKTMYYPYVKVVHVHEAASYKNKKMLVIHIRNIVRYFNKWGWFFDRERRQVNRELLQELGYRK